MQDPSSSKKLQADAHDETAGAELRPPPRDSRAYPAESADAGGAGNTQAKVAGRTK